MNAQDRLRMRNAIDMAIDTLEREARCYCYRDEPEHLELVAYLQQYRHSLKESAERSKR